MKHFSIYTALMVALLCCWNTGCVRQLTPEELAARVEVLQSRQVRLQAEPGVKPVVAVVVRDNAQVAELRRFTEDALRARGYEITENPSLAGYVLQLNAIHAGLMDADKARRSVPQGYGYKISGGGGDSGDTFAFVADVLVASRTVPKMKGRQSLVIANTSSNTVLNDEELRVGALLRAEKLNEHAALVELEKAVVKVVAGMFPAAR